MGTLVITCVGGEGRGGGSDYLQTDLFSVFFPILFFLYVGKVPMFCPFVFSFTLFISFGTGQRFTTGSINSSKIYHISFLSIVITVFFATCSSLLQIPYLFRVKKKNINRNDE